MPVFCVIFSHSLHSLSPRWRTAWWTSTRSHCELGVVLGAINSDSKLMRILYKTSDNYSLMSKLVTKF